MTDNEIIKALEEMADYPHYYEEGQILKNVLDLIDRQKAEIETLKEFIMEISRCDKEIKSESVKEFAERLKNKIKTECNPYGKPTFDYDTSISIMRYIDNLVKEMVGEDNA